MPAGLIGETAAVAIYEMTDDDLRAVPTTTFSARGIRERDDLQRLLRARIEIVAADVLVIAEEFGDFEGARRRIDLLGLGRDGRIVVIELKRTEDGGHMELQAIRYAAMVSAMTFEQVVDLRSRFAVATALPPEDSRAIIADWLSGEETLSDDVRIVLVSADFGVEVTTAVLWLTTRHDLDILCVRAVPYELDGRLLLDVQQVIPLPEARDYQIQLRRKEEQTRMATTVDRKDRTQYQLIVDGQVMAPTSKQGAIKRAVALMVERGVPLSDVRNAVGNRWKDVRCAAPEDVRETFRAAYGSSQHWWFDSPYQDDIDPDRWWVMVRVGGTETETVLERLHTLRPSLIGWQRAEVADQSPLP